MLSQIGKDSVTVAVLCWSGLAPGGGSIAAPLERVSEITISDVMRILAKAGYAIQKLEGGG